MSSKKAVVTGGAGFIGSHLCKRLLNQGYEVKCIDNFYRFNESEVEELQKKNHFEFVKADIRDREKISKEIEGFDSVIHLAAQSDVEGARENKDYAYETNVTGTWNLLRESERKGIEKFVFASSREVYGDNHSEKISEEDSLNPKNFYGASKVSAEKLVEQFGNNTDISTTSLRLANVYGHGDKNRVIPIFLRLAQNDETLKLFGGDQILDFVWIEDVLDSFEAALSEGFPYDTMNVASGEGTSIRELAELIVEMTDSNSEIKKEVGREYETDYFIGDTSRMKEMGITPTKLRQGLEKLLQTKNITS